MAYTTTLTTKGQLTIPKIVRDKAKLQKGSKIIIEFAEEKREIRLRLANDILALAGKFRTKRKITPLKARELLEKKYKRE